MKKVTKGLSNFVEFDFDDGRVATGMGQFLEDGSFFVFLDTLRWKEPYDKDLFFVSDLKALISKLNKFEKDDVVSLLWG